jgi:hypothetical protein
MDEWRRWSDPKERLKWVQALIAEKPRHPFAFLWRHLSWAGIATRRKLLGLKLKRDEPLRLRLIKGIVGEQYPRGGFRSSLGWTGLRLLQLAELDAPPDHPAIAKALRWVKGRQDPDGCFWELPSVPTSYPTLWGEEVRFSPFAIGVTAFTLCGLLRWERESYWVQRAVQWVARQVVQSREICCLPCTVHALHALAISRLETATVQAAVERLVNWLADHQSERGEWFVNPEATYAILFGLGVCPLPAARVQIAKALPMLAGLQFLDGGWGRSYRAEKTWVVTSALLFHELLETFVTLTDRCPWLGRPTEWLEQLPPSLDESPTAP